MAAVASAGRGGFVDFQALAPGHEAIDARLTNWARWCLGGRSGGTCSPMFRLYRSSDARRLRRDYAELTASSPVDSLDAAAMQKAVQRLPELHMHAINWHYVNGRGEGARRVAQRLGQTVAGLAALVSDARSMLINRGTP